MDFVLPALLTYDPAHRHADRIDGDPDVVAIGCPDGRDWQIPAFQLAAMTFAIGAAVAS